MYGYVRVIVVLLILTTKICAASGRSLLNKNEAHAQAQSAKQQSNSSVTSYFHHDPYGPSTYAFGYEVNDKPTGNVQFRDERRFMNGSVQGSYGYVRPDGRITVTHFLADEQRGYMSQTQTFAADDDDAEEHKWQQHWPTQKPHILLDKAVGAPMNATYDKHKHLNLTDDKIHESVANAVKAQHGLDLSTVVELEDNIVSPIVEEVINGEIPLKAQKTPGKKGNSTLGFETVQEFIPPDFAIAPFQLPEKLEHELEAEQQHKMMEKTATKSKYDRAKVNNAEKTVMMHHKEHLVKEGHATELIHKEPGTTGSDRSFGKMEPHLVTPKPLTGVEDEMHEKWYEKVIAENRREFLENIPNLAPN